MGNASRCRVGCVQAGMWAMAEVVRQHFRWCMAGILAVSFSSPAVSFAEESDAARDVTALEKADIPELAWTPRSDWISVKNPPALVPPKTKPGAPASTIAPLVPVMGDGKTDDSAAIQAILSQLKDGQTIYFPPGQYRIANPIVLTPSKARGWLGITLIGHGRSTVLFWDGDAGRTMFSQLSGWSCSRMVGLTWDGRGKAAVGVMHRSAVRFETENRHQYQAFRNFTSAGIHLGGGRLATAELLYENCLFDNCGNGIRIDGADPVKVNFNYLDNTISSCLFRKCATAIYSGKGTNAYVRDSDFIQSSQCDMVFSGEAGSSARRCRSYNSAKFISNSSSVGPLAIQDCRINLPDGWKGGGQDCSVVAGEGCASMVLLDNKWSIPSGQPEVLNVKARHFAAGNALVIGKGKPVKLEAGKECGYSVPDDAAAAGKLPESSSTGFRSEAKVPSKIFDVKQDFGAKGDGKADDSAAIQKAIDAAREYGKDAIAYLPSGNYAVKASLKMSGSNYRFGGSGRDSALFWVGDEGGAIISVIDPDHLVLENVAIGGHDGPQGKNEADVLQTSTGTNPTFMTYDKVRVFGMYQKKPNVRGLQLAKLGKSDSVYFNEINGNLHFTDCAEANIYLGLSYEGTVCIDGTSPNRSGFIGGAVRLGTCTDPGLWVKDNQSFVMSDFYVESSDQLMRLEGSADLPPGRVVLQGPKYEILPESTKPSAAVDNYKGMLLLGTENFYVGNKVHRYTQKGDATFTFVLWGGNFYNSRPGVEFSPSGKYLPLCIRRLGDPVPEEEKQYFADTSEREAALAAVALAFGDLRRLGRLAVEIVNESKR